MGNEKYLSDAKEDLRWVNGGLGAAAIAVGVLSLASYTVNYIHNYESATVNPHYRSTRVKFPLGYVRYETWFEEGSPEKITQPLSVYKNEDGDSTVDCIDIRKWFLGKSEKISREEAFNPENPDEKNMKRFLKADRVLERERWKNQKVLEAERADHNIYKQRRR